YQTGLEAVREQWVALLDSDDEWLPHHLDALWALAPGNVLVACSCLEVGVDGDGYGYHGLIGDRPVMLDSPAGILYPENPIPSSGAMFSRDAALAVGGFREMLCEDLDLWCRLMARGPATLSPHVGILYRTHAGQISADWAAMHAAHLGIIRELARGSRGSHGDLFERRSGVSAWDRFRVRRRARNPGARRDLVAELLRHPRRALGVIDVLGHRLATSRRASHLVREGPLSSPPRSPR
ncbi:MAG: glycosyltransferase, partial [Solirubrobacterales bacterium]